MNSMSLPTKFDDDILGYETGFGSYYPDGRPVESPPARVFSLLFPPIGFFPFYGIGNGDYHGFYWPLDREDGPPIIAFSSHDVGSLIPESSSIEEMYRCELARSTGEDESTYFRLAEQALGRPPTMHDVRELSHDDFEGLLELDPTSPYYLCAAADSNVNRGDLDSAERRYRESLKELPEYVAAHFGLASLLRRLRRMDEATVHLRECLMGPLAFYGGSFWADSSLPGAFRADWARKALHWLQRSGSVHDSIEQDPFVTAVGELTLETGVARSADMEVLEGVVKQYAAAERFADAARIWQLIGDRASYETTSFRERYGLTPRVLATRLAELFERSGRVRRATLVRNMLAMMDQPDGLYL